MSFVARNHPQQVRFRGALDPVDDRATDPEFFAALHRRFRFTVDVAASAANAKLPRFFDRTTDGLEQSWADEMVWCNPPYSSIEPWVRKAWSETDARGIVMILPANRTEQGWWQAWIEPTRDRPDSPLRIEFLPGRIRFIRADRAAIGPNERPPFGCCLAIWRATPSEPVEAPEEEGPAS